MAIPLTAMYDAWAAYDETAVGTRLSGKLRRPKKEGTTANKEKAIAFAFHRTLIDVFPGDKTWLDSQLRGMGFDPRESADDLTTPAGIGVAAATAVIEYRRHDGSNADGQEPGGDGSPYADYTGYKPVNPVDRIIDPDRWQPLPFSDAKGGVFYPGFLTPHWGHVRPFLLDRADQFRAPPPPQVGSEQMKKEVDECIEYNAALTLEQKSIAEFMRDGPRSTGQSGHWLQFAQDVSRRDRLGLDEDVKLFFVIGNTAFDAFIACWDSKRVYDTSRPWTLVRHYYKNGNLIGYLGPCKGCGSLPASSWHPYSPATFVTPPFPGYPSGHSTVSGACAKMLELFTGSDRYGAYYKHCAGQWTENDCMSAQHEAMRGKSREKNCVVLRLPTFSATAEMAGISRIMGGYHIQSDNIAGLTMGRRLAEYCWPKYQAYFTGTAAAP